MVQIVYTLPKEEAMTLSLDTFLVPAYTTVDDVLSEHYARIRP